MGSVLYAAVDVDDKAFHGAVVNDKGQKLEVFVCNPSAGALIKKLKAIAEKTGKIQVCYEAGYLGFSLQRQLSHAGLSCEVIASGLIPVLPSKKVKTDRTDAAKLAEFYAAGLLTPIHIPDLEDEADRSLLRSREFFVGQAVELKNHIVAICRRVGRDFCQETGLKSLWTQSHRDWLNRLISEKHPASHNLEISLCLTTLRNLENSLTEVNKVVEDMAASPKYCQAAVKLTAFRGIDTHSAMRIIVEIGDINRFAHPRHLTSYAGLDICEYSSGGKERKMGISKMGNTHLRQTLVESSQFALIPVKESRPLRKRRLQAPAAAIAVADRCMARLHKKGTRMLYAGKHRNKIKVACAREMLGFIWETLRAA